MLYVRDNRKTRRKIPTENNKLTWYQEQLLKTILLFHQEWQLKQFTKIYPFIMSC